VKYLLGIDNGGTVTKAAIYDLEGRELAVSGIKTKLLMPFPGFTERDTEELWKANIEVIKDVIAKSGVGAHNIAGVAVTGHGNGMYLVDESGKPVYNGIISTDTRAAAIVSKWYNDKTSERVRKKTLQAIYPGQPPALLAWFKQNNPGILEKTKWILLCKDFIRACLTGEIYTDYTDISVANLIDTASGVYDIELLKEFGLEEIINKLPPIKKSSDTCGYITKEVAALTGLLEGTPVAGGMCDMHACAIATGIIYEDLLCIIAGTWSINQYISRSPVISDDLFLSSIYCVDGYWLNIEASATSAGNLEWFVDQFLGEEKLISNQQGISVYEVCNKIIAETQPEESDILFLPFLLGTNEDPNSKACFIGMNGWHTKAHVLRSVYEGVVFSHLYHINRLLKYRKHPRSIRLSGGASRSGAWVKMFADITGIDIEIVKGTEIGSLGSAICAGIACGSFESYEKAVKSMVRLDYIQKPDLSKKEIYARRFNLYKKSIEMLAPFWRIAKQN